MIYEIAVLRQKVNDLVKKFPISCSFIISLTKYDESIKESLDFYLPVLRSSEYNVTTKIYWLLHEIEDFPKCHNKKCNNTFERRNVINLEKGYRKYCCQQCAKDSDERKELYVKACRDKWGVDNASQAPEVKEKKIKKTLEKYGVDNVAKSPEVQAVIQQTNMDRYGATTYLHSEEGTYTVEARCLERYNVTHYSQTAEYFEKCKATNRKNYGVDWPHQSREFMRNMQKRYTYKGMHFDSAPELAYFIWLEDHGIKFTYQPNLAFEYEHDDEKHVYEPDFIIEGTAVEIKGDHFFKDDGAMQNPFDHSQDALYEAKHQCMLANNVKILRSADYEPYVNYIESKHGKDYLKSFKNK